MTEQLILAELKGRRHAVDDYKGRIEKIRLQNEQLLESLEQREKDELDITSFFEEEVRRRDDAISTLQDAFREAKENWAAERREADADTAALVARLRKESDAREAELEEDLRALRIENAHLSEFKDKREEIMGRLAAAEAELEAWAARHTHEARALEFKFIADKVAIERRAETQLAELRRTVEEDVTGRLDDSTRKILQQNRRMTDDLRIHISESDDLERKARRLEDENNALKREVELSKDVQKEWAVRGQRQSREIRDLSAKVRALEQSLAEAKRDLEDERRTGAAARDASVAEAREEPAALRKLLKIRAREYRNVRSLALEILEQRTEVETFLLEALAHVKGRILQQRQHADTLDSAAAQRQYHDISLKTGTRLPAIRTTLTLDGPTAPSQLPATASRKVDISDLSWEDKETVLRVLFSKINRAAMASADQLPPHSFSIRDTLTRHESQVSKTKAGFNEGAVSSGGRAEVV